MGAEAGRPQRRVQEQGNKAGVIKEQGNGAGPAADDPEHRVNCKVEPEQGQMEAGSRDGLVLIILYLGAQKK